jgi:hypothetical protein
VEAGIGVDRAAARAQSTDLARRLLIALGILGFVVTTSGTLLFAYPSSIVGALRTATVWSHEITGDLTLGVLVWYLVVHLGRVWRMKRRQLSKWTGYASAGLWALAGGTGLYGQFVALTAGEAPWLVHLASSVALIVVVCFHGAWGLRPKMR